MLKNEAQLRSRGGQENKSKDRGQSNWKDGCFFKFCSECSLHIHVVRNVHITPWNLEHGTKAWCFKFKTSCLPPYLHHPHAICTSTRHTLQCKCFLPVAGLDSFRCMIREPERDILMKEENGAVFSASQITVTTFPDLDISIKKCNWLPPDSHCRCGALTVCFVSNGSPSPTNAHICSFFCLCSSGLVRPQDSLAVPTSSSRVVVEWVNCEFPVTPLCLWSISILTSTATVELSCTERVRSSSYPGGRATLVHLKSHSKTWICVDTKTHQTCATIHKLQRKAVMLFSHS